MGATVDLPLEHLDPDHMSLAAPELLARVRPAVTAPQSLQRPAAKDRSSGMSQLSTLWIHVAR
jgi:hypothetical protein